MRDCLYLFRERPPAAATAQHEKFGTTEIAKSVGLSGMIVTIDGPAGAGKSTAAKTLAARLGFRFLDTGAMYRAVAFAAQRRGIDLADEAELLRVAQEIQIELRDPLVLLDGEDVTRALRTMEVTSLTRHAASNAGVRNYLVALQRACAEGQNVVTEGRDQGTVAFPDAACKIFLTATPEERARRRMQDLEARGEKFDFETVLARQHERDQRDRAREVGPLAPAADAVLVVTDGMSMEEVVDHLEMLVRRKQ